MGHKALLFSLPLGSSPTQKKKKKKPAFLDSQGGQCSTNRFLQENPIIEGKKVGAFLKFFLKNKICFLVKSENSIKPLRNQLSLASSVPHQPPENKRQKEAFL